MKTIFILLTLVGLTFAQNSDRIYVIIPTSTLKLCNQKSKSFNKTVYEEIMSIGTPQGDLNAPDHRRSNDGSLTIIEFNHTTEKIEPQEIVTKKISLSLTADYTKLKEDAKELYAKYSIVDTKIATNSYVVGKFRWKKYFDTEEDIYKYLRNNADKWGSIEDIKPKLIDTKELK